MVINNNYITDLNKFRGIHNHTKKEVLHIISEFILEKISKTKNTEDDKLKLNRIGDMALHIYSIYHEYVNEQELYIIENNLVNLLEFLYIITFKSFDNLENSNINWTEPLKYITTIDSKINISIDVNEAFPGKLNHREFKNQISFLLKHMLEDNEIDIDINDEFEYDVIIPDNLNMKKEELE